MCGAIRASQDVIRDLFFICKGQKLSHITAVMWGGNQELGEWRKDEIFCLVVDDFAHGMVE